MIVEQMYAHGITQGAITAAQGGKFQHGFFSAAFSAGAETYTGEIKFKAGKVLASSVVGGTASVLGGGKFANGAITGAYVMLSNEMSHQKQNKSNSEFDIDAAVKYLDDNAQAKSTGACAAYVRKALEAGGIDTSTRPNYAKDYGSYLEDWGFEQVTTADYIKGDVAVFQNYEGGSTAGHIQMYNGSKWVSDFTQSDFWAGPGYRKNQPSYQIFRWK